MTNIFPKHVLLLVVVTLLAAQCAAFREVTATPGDRVVTKRLDMVSFAEGYVGSRYKYGGSSPSGFDCSGFTSFVYDRFDVALPHQSGRQETLGRKINVSAVKPGDLVFFRRSKGGRVFHVALVYSNTSEGVTVLHSTSSRGVVMDNISTNSYWRSKVASARDVLGGDW